MLDEDGQKANPALNLVAAWDAAQRPARKDRALVRLVSTLLVVALTLSCCKTYVPPQGSPTELATIRGNDLPLFAQHGNACRVGFIDGKGNTLGGFLSEGKHKLPPGRHTITVGVYRHDVPKRESFAAGSTGPSAFALGIALDMVTMGIPAPGQSATCSFELNVEQGHDYLVSDVANVQMHYKYGWITTLEFKVISTTTDGQSTTALVPAKCDSTPESASAKGQVAPATRRTGEAAALSSASISAPAAATIGPVAAALTPASEAAAISSLPKLGDRWTYQLSDRGRVLGRVNVAIVETSAAGVKERVTREGYPGFIAERNVDTKFNPVRFQAAVAMPGGYPLWEIAPYLPSGTQLSVGQSWGPISGDFNIPAFGKRTLTTRVSVVNQSNVRVPAGEFDAWKVETEPATVGTGGTNAVVTCTFWYSPQSLRTIKMQYDTVYNFWGQPTSEIYELSRFEPAK